MTAPHGGDILWSCKVARLKFNISRDWTAQTFSTYGTSAILRPSNAFHARATRHCN